jgi:hypothetical protein
MITANIISGAAGVLLSLGFSYIPKFSEWYYSITKQWRGLVMVGFILLVSVAVWLLSCYVGYGYVQCSTDGAKVLGEAFVSALLLNQAAYQVTPESPAKAKSAG